MTSAPPLTLGVTGGVASLCHCLSSTVTWLSALPGPVVFGPGCLRPAQLVCLRVRCSVRPWARQSVGQSISDAGAVAASGSVPARRVVGAVWSGGSAGPLPVRLTLRQRPGEDGAVVTAR